MMNNTVLVGRIAKEITIEKIDNKKRSVVTLAVVRPYKNIEGEYDTDFIPVVLYDGIAENVKDYCKIGDVVGVKGRLQMNKDKLELVTEKLTFLSRKKESEEK